MSDLVKVHRGGEDAAKEGIRAGVTKEVKSAELAKNVAAGFVEVKEEPKLEKKPASAKKPASE